jgi:hypothetical protein
MELTRLPALANGMSRRERIFLLVLVAGTCLSRIPYRAHIPYGLDSIQFVLGVEHFDVRLHQPHPPGYFLFVMLGRLLNSLFSDPNGSFIFLNAVFSGLAVGSVFLLAREIFDSRTGAYAAILMASSPLVWHHGEVALSNMTDCLLVCLLALICWKILQGNNELVPLSAVLLGLAGGVRQNTLVFLLPLWLFAILKAGWRRALLGGLCLSITVLAWYLPMARLSGGLGAYQTALREHWLNSNWHGLTLAWLPLNFVSVGYFVLLGTGLGLLPLLFGFLFYAEEARSRSHWQTLRFQFFAIWMIPSLLFFLLVYSHPIQTGHSLIYLPALLVLLPRALDTVAGKLTNICMLVLTVSNACVFLLLDTAVSRSHLEEYESEVRDVTNVVRAHCSPSETVLLNMDFMFLGFRDFMYHLPEYQSFQPRLYVLSGSKRMFAGYRRTTFLVEQITIPSAIKYFVLNADELARNPDLAPGFELGRYSQDHFLRTASGLTLLRGDVRELSQLFPQIPVVFQ